MNNGAVNMEPVFISAAILLAVLLVVSYYVNNGVGTMGAPLRQLALFLMNKAPVGLVDLFKDEPGSGSRTWIKYGTGWFILTVISGFIAIWHNHDPAALDSLASIGWSYDDGSALADFTSAVMLISFTYLLVGGCLVAVARTGNNRLASEASASMIALLYTAALSFNLMSEFKIFGMNFFDFTDFLTNQIMLPLGGIFIAIFVGWVMKKQDVLDELQIEDGIIFKCWFFVVRFVAPVMVGMVLLYFFI